MSKAAENMRQHRLKQLTIKQQQQAAQYRPPLGAKIIGVDLAAPGATDYSVEIPMPVTQNIELRLSNHLSQLKEIRALDKKVELKAQWLPEYQGYIDATLSQSPAPQNNVLMYLMIWATDTHDFELAAKIAQFAILNDMVMPEGFTRTVAEVIAEQIGEACCADEKLAEQHATLLQNIAEMVKGEDLVNEAHAKIYKAIGIALKNSQPKEALAALQNALRLNQNSGVKTLIAQLEKLLKRNTTESIHDTPSGLQESSPQNDESPATTTPQNDSAETSSESGTSGE